MAAQLKEIVDRLNAAPFNCDLSLVGFDEKDPFELMEILKKVLVFLDPKHDVDLREEKPDAMYQRISEFLHILGYQCSFDIEFQQGLSLGDKNTVHPILYWLLNNLDALRKRAYLAKFCMNLEVPEEFLREEQVYSVYQNYKELQSQFKATHSHVEQERQGRMNPVDLQREVAQLDAEREQLAQKIQHLKAKTERDEGFATLLEVTSMLRKEQEEEARLAEKLAEQKYQLEQTEQLYIERSARLREMREAQLHEGEGSAEVMLKMLSAEVIKSREALARVRKESEEKMDRLRELDSALSEPPVTKMDIDSLEGEIQAMQNEIHALEEKVNEQNQDSRLAVYKQQANLVAKKKEAVLKDKRMLEDERDSLSKDLSTKEREYEQMKGHKFMKREDFKTYAASLRDKSAKFKLKKAELSELRHEVAVHLCMFHGHLGKEGTSAYRADPAVERPNSGWVYRLIFPVSVFYETCFIPEYGARLVETEQMLEKASVEKSQVDRAKGKTLDEISAIVQKINAQLKEKKNKLAPQIKALRSIRQSFQQVEVKYLDKKGQYDQAKAAVDTDLSKVASDVRQLENEVQEAEQNYHELNMQLLTAESKLQRAQWEARCLRREEGARHSQEYATLSDQYAAEISRLDEQCKDLRKDQKVVKESHEENLKQKRAFVQLEKLIQIKLKVSMQELQNMAEGRYGGIGASRTVMDASTAGVERLVIE
ncbi:Ift81 [Symbiodinium natans]|uniref:Ift81 protein n=1 Tax=Symbiodinium natans TaxID=878477 RepID=A0A812TLJ3_9DINO|nr:Ift81 [Symbiodinium natans]